MDQFERLAPFIREYIYARRWNGLYDIQKSACEVIFDTDDNLLLSSATASGKTEAAMLPIITLISENAPNSVGVLYVSPLKALINDQFERIGELLEQANISVTRWHADASAAQKKKLLAKPSGILQITPESLESLLLNKTEKVKKLFAELRFVIIDEVHYFMSSERGVQLKCQLERLTRLCGCDPRRIGLSATLGDIESAKRWLSAGTKRDCRAPIGEGEKKKLGLLMQTFERKSKELMISSDAHKEFLYEKTLGKKSIIFAQSRAETEQIASALREIAAKKHTPDVYRVHHGSISASLREETEHAMKEETEPIVTAATVTLELGIDIGSLERVVQVGSPRTLSSFTQRVGRAARRGQPAQLIFTLEESKLPDVGFVGARINWDFVATIAIIELFLKEKWIEPLAEAAHPYALCAHQTLSILASAGELKARELAKSVLTLSAFSAITAEDYKSLLHNMLSLELLEKNEQGNLIVGLKGERYISTFDFFSVFESKKEYSVKSEQQLVGSLCAAVSVGTRFALAGRSWEAFAIDEAAGIIHAKPAASADEYLWSSHLDGQTHTHILQKMREVLISSERYAYLSAHCRERLEDFRRIFAEAALADKTLLALADGAAFFPWIGTRGADTLTAALKADGLNVRELPSSELPVYLELSGAPYAKIREKLGKLLSCGVDKTLLPIDENARLRSKYNDMVPTALLRAQYILDYLDDSELNPHCINIVG